MNKYIRAAFCVPFAEIKYIFLKVTHMNKFSGNFPAVVSPLTEITLEKHASLHIGKKLKMHNGSKIRVRRDAKVKIGNNFAMSNGCVLTSYESIQIGNDVMLGPNVLIYDQDHDYDVEGGVKAMSFKTAPIVIGNNVWIAANSIVLRGSVIGNNVVIAAGSIVKGTVPDNTLYVQKRSKELIDIRR